MSDTTYVVTIDKRVKGKQKKTVQKFDTEKKARKFYEQERQTLIQDNKWGDVLVDSACFFCATNNCSGIDHVGASVILSTEVNFEYYVKKLFLTDPNKILKFIKAIYNRGYDKGWENGHWES